jgi:DNA-binding beta-propeller fold protein YncE
MRVQRNSQSLIDLSEAAEMSLCSNKHPIIVLLTAILAIPLALVTGDWRNEAKAFKDSGSPGRHTLNVRAPRDSAWSVEQGERSAQAADTPRFQIVPFWPAPLPDKWITGEVGGTCIDAQDHVFIVNRRNLTDREDLFEPAPPVIEFDAQGRIVHSWGNPDTLPQRIHGCYIDHEGNIWVGGTQDAIVQKYTHDGSKLLLQIGTKGLYDTSDGTFEGTAMNSSTTLLNRPSGIAVDAANGDVYVADGYGNHRVIVFDRNGRFLRQWGQQGTAAQAEAGVGGVFLKTVHCVVIGNDGLVYVCDRGGDRVQVFDKMGHFRKNIWVRKGTGT